MLGLSPKEARARFDQVIEFAELEEFVDLKLKNYSSGMQVRLAFSVMIQADADMLLVDEVLAVGDASFQQKCFDVFQGLKDAGKTILFVTHDMGAVQRFCDRALLIESGEVQIIGEPDARRRPVRRAELRPRGAARSRRARRSATDRRARRSSRPGSRTSTASARRRCRRASRARSRRGSSSASAWSTRPSRC